MKKIGIILLFLGIACVISCGEDEEPGNSVTNLDISGEFEGQLVDGLNKGIVVYSFVSNGDDTYTGFYEGNEFAQITVIGDQLQGEPSNGNTAFTTLLGVISEDNSLALGFFDNSGNQVASFSGDQITPGTRVTADIIIDGKEFVQIIRSLSVCSNTGGVIYYNRIGDIEPEVSFIITCGVELEAGTYPIGDGIFDAAINVNWSYGDGNFDSVSGNVIVSGSTDSFISYDFSNVTWELDFGTGTVPTLSGDVVCIY